MPPGPVSRGQLATVGPACAGGAEACITVTVLDGLVLARSTLHHSMNHRSVMAFGRSETVTDEAEKEAAKVHLVPGRSAGTRQPTDRHAGVFKDF